MNIKCVSCCAISHDMDICNKCGKVIQLDDKMVLYKDTPFENAENWITLFDILNITEQETFSNDILLLKCNQKQEKFHPDKHIYATQFEKLIAMHRASICNRALVTLSDFVSRVEYILQVHRIKEVADDSILKDLFMLNIKFEESDSEGKLQIMTTIKDKVFTLQKLIIKIITLSQYDNVSKYLIELRYLTKMKKNLHNLTILS
ncbi:Co-chaperone protein HscB [Candidatus Fokinia solitaria]|uniref:Co-chaperone protein HscB n=1 Tax=Candidatus Fokinia solitaria TaxID=1802984 RepID=A0A2U8BRF6_9RICK|nr:hypothetical protein [Candidatus Fokinia solitaria]AWD32936.1 Co-chaperone protein HscB [Candidatus Fokinia solitaria]